MKTRLFRRVVDAQIEVDAAVGDGDISAVGPAAQSVVTHPDQVGRFLDPKYRHQQTLTQIRLKITHGGVSAVIMDRD